MSNAALNICVQVFVWLSEEAHKKLRKEEKQKAKEKRKNVHI